MCPRLTPWLVDTEVAFFHPSKWIETMFYRRSLLLALVLLLTVSPSQAQEFPADTRPFVNLAYKVKGTNEYVRMGSGTIINKNGLIVTNEHVFNLSSAAPEEIALLDLSVAYVFFDRDNNRHTPPELLYEAQKLAYWYSGFPGEPDYDVALMRITKDLTTGTTITSPNFPFVPLGNPFDLPDNAIITILGFPSVGGKNLSISSGPWISYQEGNPLGIPDGAILTTAAIWPGNSGGAALYNGKLIGLPTSQSAAEVDAGYIHPITWASPLLGFIEFRQDIQTPNIDKRWVVTERNRDVWTRTRSTFMAYVNAEGNQAPVEGATVYIYPTKYTFEDVKSNYQSGSHPMPFLAQTDEGVAYSVAKTRNDGFFETWIEKGSTFRVSIEKKGYTTFHSHNITAVEHVVQWMPSPFIISPDASMRGFVTSSEATKQAVALSDNFPTDFRKMYWDRDQYITDLSFGNGKWALSMTGVPDFRNQHNAVKSSYEEVRDVIREKWEEDYYITDFARGNGKWIVSLTQGTPFTSQTYWHNTSFPGEWIDEKWKEGFQITNVTHGDGTWVVVMSKGMGWGTQSWATRSSYDEMRTYIKEKWDQGYTITNVAHGNGQWLAIMTTNSGYSEQVYTHQTSHSDLNQFIEEMWTEGKRVVDLAHGNDGWWVLFAKGEHP